MDRIPQRRVAVIGSGLAGLTAAYLLRQEGAEVWLIEKADRLGFHSQSVDIPLRDHVERGEKTFSSSDGKSRWVVDVPMRSFQGGYYPLLIALYRHLSIPLVPTFYTFSFSRLSSAGQTRPYFIHTGASGSAIPSLPSRSYKSLRSLIRAIGHFIGIALAYILWVLIAALGWHDLLPTGRQTTLRKLTANTSHYLTYPLSYFSNALPKTSVLPTPLGSVFTAFMHDIILPLFSAVGTMTTSDVLDTPVGSLLDYVHSTLGTSHFTLGPGYSAGTVAGRLASEVEKQGAGYSRLGEEVLDIEYDEEIRIRCRGGDIQVDQIVLATQASAAAMLLGMLEKSLREKGEKEELKRVCGMRNALREVEYRETIVVTHRDRSILPSKADQREINLTTPVNPLNIVSEVVDDTPPLSASSEVSSPTVSSPSTPPPGDAVPHFIPQPDSVYSMGTHIIQPPSHLKSEEAILQTTNPVCPIDPETVLAVSRMERALPLREPTIFARLHPSPESGKTALVHLAGSYAYPGIPLLEGCVGSAINATSAIIGKPCRDVGQVDWEAGRGALIGRAWRWRRSGISSR